MPLVGIAQVVLRTAAAAGLMLGLASSCKLSPKEPSGVVPEACCKVVSSDLQQGAGCRVASRCRVDEPIWMRGAVMCSPKEPERCMGGRCCKYGKMYGAEGAVYNWEGADEGGSATDPPAGSAPAAESTEPTEPTNATVEEPSDTATEPDDTAPTSLRSDG